VWAESIPGSKAEPAMDARGAFSQYAGGLRAEIAESAHKR
jgi:hypothetical protein